MEFALQKTVYASEVKLIRRQMKMKQKELANLMKFRSRRWSTGKAAKGRCREQLRQCSVSCGNDVALEELEIPKKEFPS